MCRAIDTKDIVLLNDCIKNEVDVNIRAKMVIQHFILQANVGL